MKNFLRDIKLIAFIALLWVVGGALVSAGLNVYFGVEWLLPCSSLSLLLGMLLLLIVLRDEQTKRRLLSEADDEMPFKLSLAALLLLPALLIVVGLLWLLTAPLLPK